MNVTIVGTGYVGLTTGLCLAYLGHKVHCLDVDESKVESLRRGELPFYEPHLDELLALARPNLTFTSSYPVAIPNADVIFIAVGTPSQPDGRPDLQSLESAARCTGQHLGERFTVIVNKSTVPVGSGNWVESIVRDTFAKRTGPKGSFAVASNPEFLREGSALQDSFYPDRIVIGADHPHALETLYTLYRPLLDQSFPQPVFLPRPENFHAVPLVSTDLASAELIKYAANAFLALKISYINEIGRLASKAGADINQVARGIGLDARIGPRFLQAGLGWGGSCFGKDTQALIYTAKEYHLEMPIVAAAREVNTQQRQRVIERLLDELKILKGRTIGLLGLAFKPFTDDVRDAPALDIAQRLIERGARVRAHDPVAIPRAQRQFQSDSMTYCQTVEETADQADALVLVTEWPQYVDYDWTSVAGRMRSPVLLDGRRCLRAPAGFRYLLA
jgi:UDPglucose 6-dehydrogenase